jgi:hypothetical protein
MISVKIFFIIIVLRYIIKTIIGYPIILEDKHFVIWNLLLPAPPLISV